MFLKYLLSFLFIFASALAQAATFTVNSTEDGVDADPGDGACAGANPAICTLRAAIEEANRLEGADVIVFSIAGDGPHVIQPASALPSITETLTIDGTTEAGYVAGELPLIVIDGSGAGAGVDGLFANSSSLNAYALNVNSFSGIGIIFQGDGPIMQGCVIGLSADGEEARPNGKGVLIDSFSGIVGGAEAGERNVISGNITFGIGIDTPFPATIGNVIQGNYIGTDFSGTVAIPNGIGIYLDNSAIDTIVGGAAANEGNVISGNVSHGIQMGGSGNLIYGNFIGTDATGEVDLGNGASGIDLTEDAANNNVGGVGAGQANTIAFNDNFGITLDAGVFHPAAGAPNYLFGNLIYSNDQFPAIDIISAETNDELDVDGGPNNSQNFPVLTSVVAELDGTVTVNGELDSAANSDYTIYFSTQSNCNEAGDNAQSEQLLDFVAVTTDADGHAGFSHTFDPAPDATLYISSLANSEPDGTSPFSNCLRSGVRVGFESAAVEADEADGNVAVNILSNYTPADFTVDYMVTSGTADANNDFVLASGVLSFAADVTTQAITVAVADDSADETDETFTVTLSNPSNGADFESEALTFTIIDNDAPADGPDGSDNDDGSADSAAAASSSGGGCALVLPR